MRAVAIFSVSVACVGAAVGLAACDNGPAAIETRAREAPPEAAATAAAASATAPAARPAERPRWSSTSRYSAEENARRAFERNGADFGATTVEAYVAAAHAFIADPPDGAETLRRGNGDILYYHAASNTFAVATRDGAPRTLFKPDDGAAYWAEQQQREAAGAGRGQ